MKVKLLNLQRQHEALGTELTAAFERCLEKSSFIQGAEVESFEKEFGLFAQAPHALSVANGTDALEIVIECLSLPLGSKIIVPTFTFAATAEAVIRNRHHAVFADCDPEHLCLSLTEIQKAFSRHPDSRALIVVHLYGRLTPEMPEIQTWCQQNNITLIEDCAQSHGATGAGRFGIAATYSFFPGKNLGALGDGGAITTPHKELNDRCRCVRDHGRTAKYLHQSVGRNSRLDALQAAFLRVKLPHLTQWNRQRRELASFYRSHLKDEVLELPPIEEFTGSHVFHQFVVQVKSPLSRDRISAHLSSLGIETGVHYPLPLHAQPAFACDGSSFPHASLAAHQVLSLPMDPFLSPSEAQTVVNALKAALHPSTGPLRGSLPTHRHGTL